MTDQPPTGTPKHDLAHEPEHRRYVLRVDGRLATALDYVDDGTVVSMTRTFTVPPFRRQGLAAELVAFAVDDVESKGKVVRPMCWFVGDWFRAHPERGALLADG